jgi:hypothetical protein
MDERQQGYLFRGLIYNKALEHYGFDNQLIIAVEELSEAQKEICKFFRGEGNIDHIAEEVADAFIMLEQVERIFGIRDKVTREMEKKVLRLSQRIQADKE